MEWRGFHQKISRNMSARSKESKCKVVKRIIQFIESKHVQLRYSLTEILHLILDPSQIVVSTAKVFSPSHPIS
jgi:hypothetical protein